TGRRRRSASPFGATRSDRSQARAGPAPGAELLHFPGVALVEERLDFALTAPGRHGLVDTQLRTTALHHELVEGGACDGCLLGLIARGERARSWTSRGLDLDAGSSRRPRAAGPIPGTSSQVSAESDRWRMPGRIECTSCSAR